MISIPMPLYIRKGIKKPKNFHFNLNNYRNWHYQVSNNLKIEYKDIAEEKLKIFRCEEWLEPPFRLHFVLWKKDKRKVDRANVLSVHEKFFCDALVELGYVTDDNDNYISSSHYYTGGVCKNDPRVDIYIQKGDSNDNINFLSQLPEDL